MDLRRRGLRDELLALIEQGGRLTLPKAARLLGARYEVVRGLRIEFQMPWPCRACGRPVPFPSDGGRRQFRCPGCARALAEVNAARPVRGPNMGPKRSRLRDQLLVLIDQREPLTLTQAARLLGTDRARVRRLQVLLRLAWPCRACGRPVPFSSERDNPPLRCRECVRMVAEVEATRRAEAEWVKAHCRRCSAFIGAKRSSHHPRLLCGGCVRRAAAAYQSARRYLRGQSTGGFADGRRKYPISDVLEYLEEHG